MAEIESLYISYVEFANIVEDRKSLKDFRGRSITNQFEIVIREVVGSKYDSNITLNFETCCPKERKRLRTEYDRLKKKMRNNSNRGRKLSFELDGTRPFISSQLYPTLIVSTPHQPPPQER